jgi:S-adenosylmethionine-diacylglycerol 3-amino-3-carboxypropyl transferase
VLSRAPAALPRGGALALLHGRQLIYNQCWEDPAVDHRALALGPDDRVLVITSAGCNALDYALSGAQVVAVDANPRQTYLLELKLAAIRALDHQGAFELFGEGASPRAGELYAAARVHLPAEAAAFWDHRWRAFARGEARGGSFYYHGTAGLFAYALRVYLEALGLRPTLNRLLAAPDVEAQLRVYESELRDKLFRRGFLALLGRRTVMALLGVPPAQGALVRSHAGGLGGYLRACLERVLALALLRDNYFWRVYLTGSYAREACPRYLEPAGFARLKAGLVDNVRAETATVASFLAGTRERFSAFVLLDHMDWLSAAPELLAAEWRQIFARATPGARVIFRSAGADAAFLPDAVRARLRFDEARARELHALDRVGTYGSFHLAHVAA